MLSLGLGLLAVYLFTISPLASQLGTRWLVSFLPADVGSQADAIVVLGRGDQQNSIRAEVAGQLWQAQRAPIIFPSGRKDALLMAQLIKQKVSDAVIEGEPCSLTTEENAEFTAALLRPKGVKTIILVTDPPHMKRSLLTFESFGFKVIPYFSPLSDDTGRTKKRFIVAREIIGFWQYKMMGRYSTRPVPPPSVINEEEPALKALKFI